jgi:hypothetical protein
LPLVQRILAYGYLFQVSDNLQPFQTLEQFNGALAMPFYREIMTLMCWNIWIIQETISFSTRNDPNSKA